jgi:hypothetical protein
LRSSRHSKNWTDYAAEKSAMMSTVGAPAEYDDLNVGEVEAAYTSTRMMRNSILEYKTRAMRRAAKAAESEESNDP